MRGLFLFITVLIFCQAANGQVEFSAANSPGQIESETDSISIPIIDGLRMDQDPLIKKMLKWHIQDNKMLDGMEGYRVEIFSSSTLKGRERALEKKVEFLSLYPEENVYVKFRAPVFKVRVGDFRTKNEALKVYKKIQKNYPGAFIVPDIIDFPVLKTNNYERTN